MRRRVRILLTGAAFAVVGLVWTIWAFGVGFSETHLPIGERTQTLTEIGVALVVFGILIMIASQFSREDK